MGLDGHVDHFARHGRLVDFGLGDLDEGVLGTNFVDLGRGVEHDEARCVDLDTAKRNALEGCALAGERLAEGRPARVVGARDEVSECFLRLYTTSVPHR